MVSRQHVTYGLKAHFVTGQPNDLPGSFTHRTLKNCLAVFRDPNEIKTVVKSATTLKRTGWKPVVYIQ